MIHRNVDRLGVQHDVANFIVGNLAILVGHDDAAAVVEAPEMSARHAGVDIANLDIGTLFRLN